jgi:cell division topological specificity factor
MAKERLQILMAHERANRSSPDYLPMMQKEILAVIAKYIDIAEEKVAVKLDRSADFSTLEVNIELPVPSNDRRKVSRTPQPAAR